MSKEDSLGAGHRGDEGTKVNGRQTREFMSGQPRGRMGDRGRQHSRVVGLQPSSQEEGDRGLRIRSLQRRCVSNERLPAVGFDEARAAIHAPVDVPKVVIERTSPTGWKRTPVLMTSNSRAAWCIRCRAPQAPTAMKPRRAVKIDRRDRAPSQLRCGTGRGLPSVRTYLCSKAVRWVHSNKVAALQPLRGQEARGRSQ